MKGTILIFILLLFISCFGSEEGFVQMQIKIPLIKQIADKDGADVEERELSIDSYFAIADVVINGERSGYQSQSLFIRYSDVKIGNYFFETTFLAVLGERINISFGGYYNIDETSVGGFVSDKEYQIEVREGMFYENTFESRDISICELNIKVQDQTVSSIIFYDSVKGIFLKTIKKSVETNSFYLKVPEGKYDIYAIDKGGEKALIKKSVEVKGSQTNIDI